VASAVMVGVAAEQMMLVLRKAVYGALASPEKKRFDNEAQGQVTRIYDAVWKRLDLVREQMPGRLRESVGVELAGVFELVRKTRNEAGPPTGRSIESEEVEALLLLFPTYSKRVYAPIGWLKTQQL
jgi:hypothetical protein